ncbi:ferritin-like domain-containing protein [Aquisphaera insulae]|uniref:ferritin-like domain-containing protein n=1 Tax=Aquisphaera insulae TaxID=2712864 RepID=UPI0013EA03DD|nr:ferritin-like domain-containing protein [Aquisphaera insulae]
MLLLLSEACELEHGLACAYLYAAFSLKQDLAEGGMTWDQQQKVRLWAAQIHQVAAEEMLHLASAWNLQAAIGGVPWYGRPNFPQSSDYYPLHLPLEALPFSLTTLDRFLDFERPTNPHLPPLPTAPHDPARDFRSVGELYRTIQAGILARPEAELFIGNPAHQVGPELMDFPDLIRVVGQKSACEAIETIVTQGEGCGPDAPDSHYAIFRRIRREYLEESLRAEQNDAAFDPVRPCVGNPTVWRQAHLGAPNARLVTDPLTAGAVAAFDSVYSLMLRLLQYVFDSATGDVPVLRAFSSASLQLMTTVIKPLGEALAVMPAGPEYGMATAGPSFTLGRLVPLPHEPRVALRVAEEKLARCRKRLTELAGDPATPARLRTAAERLAVIRLQPVS